MKIYTIGFTKKSAEGFFTRLRQARVARLVDIRLNNSSQLAGFTKRDDLAYFVKAICGIDYVHLPELAPTHEIMDEFKKNKGDWKVFESSFNNLLSERQVEKKVKKELLDGGCLLCSEDKPTYCHRRLVAEYLKAKWGNVEIEHIL